MNNKLFIDEMKYMLAIFSQNIISKIYNIEECKNNDIKKIFDEEITLLINNISVHKRKIEYVDISDEEDYVDIHFKRKKDVQDIEKKF